jgi:hypothetical protein
MLHNVRKKSRCNVIHAGHASTVEFQEYGSVNRVHMHSWPHICITPQATSPSFGYYYYYYYAEIRPIDDVVDILVTRVTYVPTLDGSLLANYSLTLNSWR